MKSLLLILSFSFISTQAMSNESSKLEVVPNELIVKWSPGLQRSEMLNAKLVEAGVKQTHLGGSYSLIRSPPTADLNFLLNDSSVEGFEANRIFRTQATLANDPKLKDQWGLQAISAQQAWSRATDASQIVVAVIDTGVTLNHSDLQENLWVNKKEANGKPGVDDDGNGFIDDVSGYDFIKNTGNVKDPHGHGTHCAGVIGARGNNAVGIAGVAWRVPIMALRFLNAEGSGTLANGIRAIYYAVENGARIISASWGGPGPESAALTEAIRFAGSKGVLFVAAAGNDGSDNNRSKFWPANTDSKNMISVGAVSRGNKKARFSNYGLGKVHVGAPGVDILSTIGKSSYAMMSGTSMAAPHVSGLAALIWSQKPSLSFSQLREVILQSATPVKDLNGKWDTGAIINAVKAIARVK